MKNSLGENLFQHQSRYIGSGSSGNKKKLDSYQNGLDSLCNYITGSVGTHLSILYDSMNSVRKLRNSELFKGCEVLLIFEVKTIAILLTELDTFLDHLSGLIAWVHNAYLYTGTGTYPVRCPKYLTNADLKHGIKRDIYF